MEVESLIYLAGLIKKYLRGELEPGEKEVLDRWLSQSDKNDEAFRRICSEDFLQEYRKRELLFSADEACERFIREVKPRRVSRRLRRIRYVAAVVVLLIGAGVLYQIRTSRPETVMAAFPAAGSAMARLTLADGRVMQFCGAMSDTLQQAGAKLYASGEKIEYRLESEAKATGFNELEVPRKGEYFLLLSDGTRVWLNSETRLRYPVVFPATERQVEVSGEAYFEVRQDMGRPFRIKISGESTVEVTGTAFNVHAYPDEDMTKVTLVEGSVNLSNPLGKVALVPGEQGRIVSGGLPEKSPVNVSLYTAWKDGRFVFKEQTLEEIMQTISRWYDVQVEFADQAVRQVTFSGNIRRYDDFGKIIGMLESIRIARFEVKGNQIYVFAYTKAD